MDGAMLSPFDQTVAFEILKEAIAHEALGTADAPVQERGGHTRSATFELGRRAARKALLSLGAPDTPLGRRDDGAPIFPAGFLGSISHTVHEGTVYAVGAASLASAVCALGVDIERFRSPRVGLLERIGSAQEIQWANERDTERRTITIFSAREALYKAVRPFYGYPMRYEETELRWDETRGGFSATTLLPRSNLKQVESFVGVRVDTSFVVTGVAITRGEFSEVDNLNGRVGSPQGFLRG